jgi:hypothetical protein
MRWVDAAEVISRLVSSSCCCDRLTGSEGGGAAGTGMMIMPLYAALLYYGEDCEWMAREHMLEHRGCLADAMAAGVARGAEALCAAGTATTITVAGGRDGEVLITDGPYAEAKEVLGGFYLLEAADLDEAIRWAAQIPTAWHGKVELRPVLSLGASAIRQ